jgi:hypothetical protein
MTVDCSQDLVVLHFCLHHLSIREQDILIKEARRIMLPKAVLVIREMNVVSETQKLFLEAFRITTNCSCGQQHDRNYTYSDDEENLLEELDKFYYESGSLAFRSREEWRTRMETEGFTLVHRSEEYLRDPNIASVYQDYFVLAPSFVEDKPPRYEIIQVESHDQVANLEVIK